MNQNKRLVRSEHEKMIAGVCGGIGNYFDIDVTIVRLLFVIATIAGVGTTIPLYFILWLILPTTQQAALPPQSAVKANFEEMKHQAQSLFNNNQQNRQEQPRFDPYTGQPLDQTAQPNQRRFDPYTGEPVDQA